MKERIVYSRDLPKFNPFLTEFHANPYPFYHQLREKDPVHKSFLDVWVLTRYEDVKAVLRDARFKADELPLKIKAKSNYANDPQAFTALATVTKQMDVFSEPT